MTDRPKDLAEWKAQAANDALFRQMESEGSEAQRMLERTDTNRIVSAEQARGILLWETQAHALGEEFGPWMMRWIASYQDLQLTIGQPENSRFSFARIVIAKAQSKISNLFGNLFGGEDRKQ